MMRFHELENKGNRSHCHFGFELVVCMLDSRDLPAASLVTLMLGARVGLYDGLPKCFTAVGDMWWGLL